MAWSVSLEGRARLGRLGTMDTEIFVFGDRFEHRAIIHKLSPDESEQKTGFGPRYDCYSEKTGAPFVAKTINYAQTGKPTGPASDALKDAEPQLEIIDIYEYTFIGKTKAKDEDKTLRRASRYITDLQNKSTQPITLLPRDIGTCQASGQQRIGVFIDYDVDFHNSYLTEEKRDQWSGSAFCKLSTVVIAIGNGLKSKFAEDYDQLCKILLTDNDPLSPASNRAERTVILLKLKALQSAGIEITDSTTVEACVKQIKTQLIKPSEESSGYNVAIALLKLANHLIIIGDNGVFYLNNNDGYLQFMPNFKRTNNTTHVPNELAVYISSLLKYGFTSDKIGDAHAVNRSIRLAMLAYSHLFNVGIGPLKRDDPSKWSPFEAVAKIIEPSQVTHGVLKDIIENKEDKYDNYLFSSLYFKLDEENWKRTNVYEEHEPSTDDVFHRIIRLGVEKGLRAASTAIDAFGLPSARIDCPYAQFGKIKLVDDEEIEQYSNCRRIIMNYLNNKDWRKPLSIGVFGKPGIGKSFAVQQLVKMNQSDSDETPLVFNLAQFDSLDQLTECFHTIQSAVLSSQDRPPLIMFDEFDADFGRTPLGWLKYFLAPMQDGEFRGKSGTYKIGRAIFTFAGGTSEKFENFQTKGPRASEAKQPRGRPKPEVVAVPLEPRVKDVLAGESRPPLDGSLGSGAAAPSKTGSYVESQQSDSEKEEFLKSVKLPDFVSRLHGHLNLADLGEYKEGKLDHIKLLKRAMLIRTFLEQHHLKSIFSGDEKRPGRANIDGPVVKYFLARPSYHRLVMASLPPDSQIDHHGGSRN
jgi:hypothetical protein